MGSAPKVFSRRTLEEFEAASASIPLRQIDRAFKGADIRLAQDPGGPDGARRMQFRRYIASVDQRDPQQLNRLGDVLGALIDEVASSKRDFLVNAAERDGFTFADGIFRRAGTASSFFSVASVEDFASIDDRGKRLHFLANDSPKDAIGGASQLVESLCRTILRRIGEPAPGKSAPLSDIAESTLEALEFFPAGTGDAKGAAVVHRCLQQLNAVVATLDELQNVFGSRHGRDGKGKDLSPRHARLAVGAAVTFAGFVAETYGELAAKND